MQTVQDVHCDKDAFIAEDLPAVQRVLMITDGTVTDILSSLFLEQIKVVKLRESVEPAGSDSSLAVDGQQILARTVLLRGETSGRVYIQAESRIVLDRLPATVRRSLLQTSEPIGLLMARERMETYREVTGRGSVVDQAIQRNLGLATQEGLVGRTYLVWYLGEPIMRISETFPQQPYLGSSLD